MGSWPQWTRRRRPSLFAIRLETKSAKLDEAVIGDSVSGAYVRNGERAELTKLNLARKADDKPKAEKKDKAKSK